jgi:hypothetical protein
VPAWRGWRACRETGDPIVIGLWAGTIAFMLTCMSGHPLLVPEVAAAFAVALGTLAAARGPAPAPPPDALPRRRRWVGSALALGALALALSVPVRARAERDALDLEHVVLGKGRWTATADARQAAFRDRLAFYVAGDGHVERLTLRPAKRLRRPIDVTLRLDGVVANVVRLSGRESRPVTLVVPREGRGRFRILSLEAAVSPNTRGPRILVQRPVP